MKKLIGCCILLSNIVPLYALNSAPHALMQLNNNIDNSWVITPAMIHEKGTFYKNASMDSPMKPGDTLSLKARKSEILGWQYDNQDDFNVAYTLSAVMQQDGNKNQFSYSSPACVFIVTAPHAADPNVQIVNYNNAHCQYQDNGQGGIFTME